MKKPLFDDFPHAQYPSSDGALNRVVREFGGWIRILDPEKALDEDFATPWKDWDIHEMNWWQ